MFYFIVTLIKGRLSDILFFTPHLLSKGGGKSLCYKRKVQAPERFPLS